MLFLRVPLYVLAIATTALAQSATAPIPQPDPLSGLPPEITALLKDQTQWFTSASVQAGFGYKDNVLLSHVGGERSSFARYGFDVFAGRSDLLAGQTDLSGGITAEQTRYFSSATVRNEAYADSRFQWQHQFKEDTFNFAVDFSGSYFDHIYDVSDTDVQRTVAQQKYFVGSTGPTLRWSPLRWLWLEAQAQGTRDSHREPVFNSKLGEGIVRLGWMPGERFELSLSGTERTRRYDQRPQYSENGRPLGGTLLVMREREGEIRCEIYWDAAKHWRTVTRAGTLQREDNGAGYFNQHRRQIRQRLAWKTATWLVTFDGAAKGTRYEVQTVGFGVKPPQRIKEDYSTELRIERNLSKMWAAYVGYNWERSRSNDEIASYRVNEGLIGARWSWEK